MFYLLRGIGDRDAGGGGATVALAASPLRYPQPFLTPKPLNLFVIHDPDLTAGVAIGRPEPTTWMVAGIFAQPSPQGGIGIPGVVEAGSNRWVARCCPVTRQANRSLTPSTR